jgi:hypothetical protein
MGERYRDRNRRCPAARSCQETPLRTALGLARPRDPVETEAELQPLAVAKLLKAIATTAPRGPQWAERTDNREVVPVGTDACRAARLAAGDLRLEGRYCHRRRSAAGDRQARDRRRPGNAGDGAPCGDHRGPALERAALCNAAEYHEGEEEAAGGREASAWRRRAAAARHAKVVEPPKGGGKVADAKELVAKLRNEAKVI